MIQIDISYNSIVLKLIDKEQLADLIVRWGQTPHAEEAILMAMLDDSGYIGNGFYCNQTIGLTEMLNIGIGATFKNDEIIDFERLFVYKDTYTMCFYDELIETGQVEFIEV